MLLAVVIVTAAGLVLSLRQERLYAASADVLINRDNLSAMAAGTQATQGYYVEPERLIDTQVRLARTRVVAGRALRVAHVNDRSPAGLLGSSSVEAAVTTDIISFRVIDPNPVLARRLATAYARAFTRYRHELDTQAIGAALRQVRERIAELGQPDDRNATIYANLTDKEQQLKTMEALQASNVFLVEPADPAGQTQPRPLRNGALAFFLGLTLGLGLALLREALDTRVRSASELVERLGLPLLARIPEPPRMIRAKNELVIRDAPRSVHAEAYRVLRTNLEFVNLERDARTIMVTSAVQGEGKSTTAANLAIALARIGRRVVLVDLDLRRPFLGRFFDLEGKAGVTDVALGHADLRDALTPVDIQLPSRNGSEPTNGYVSPDAHLQLHVVSSGPLPPDPGEFMGTEALGRILEDLVDLSDVVIIDSPPLLGLGDTIALSSRVDALLVVARLDILRRPMLTELKRVLDSCPPSKLGFVLAGADSEDGYGYGYGYGYPAKAYALEPKAVKESVR